LATNALTLVGDLSFPFAINCNTSGLSSNQTIIWLQTTNKSGIFYVQFDSRITSLTNGQLSFSRLFLIDEEYYGCGYIDPSTNKLKLVNTFYLYIRGKILFVFLNN
jgi:hypothetical protein